MTAYPKRLIEVDLPIRRISAHARREKSIRHGHISTLHIWWARRPLAACRAVICAALWPDPADENCPRAFRDAAALALCDFAEKVRTNAVLAGLCRESWSRWLRTTSATMRGDNPAAWPDMRYALLDFIADFANWDASTVPAFLETARLLTRVAHVSLADPDFRLPICDLRTTEDNLHAQIENLKSKIENTPRPLVVDPFAGGGSIPLEALRVGADAFASDLNPVAVLLNKVVLEYIPKYGNAEITMRNAEGEEVTFHGLAEAVRYWGDWIKRQAEAELAEFYPKDPDGATPIAYLWARTITCEGPGCGAEVPLIRSLWLAKKGEHSIALRLVPRTQAKRVDFEIVGSARQKDVGEGTVRRGSATCPVCGYTTPVSNVRRQLIEAQGGADTSRLIAVALRSEDRKSYILPPLADGESVKRAQQEIVREAILPPTELPLMSGVFNVPIYGMVRWDLLFSARQLLTTRILQETIEQAIDVIMASRLSNESATALKVILLFALDKYLDFRTTCAHGLASARRSGIPLDGRPSA